MVGLYSIFIVMYIEIRTRMCSIRIRIQAFCENVDADPASIRTIFVEPEPMPLELTNEEDIVKKKCSILIFFMFF